VISDIGLPGMDGYDVARPFRRHEALRDTFLVAVSGHAQPGDVQRARNAGFNRHVAKPASLNRLEHLLAEAPPLAVGREKRADGNFRLLAVAALTERRGVATLRPGQRG
jgi:CheY-like chemotaxis protein